MLTEKNLLVCIEEEFIVLFVNFPKVQSKAITRDAKREGLI